MRLRKSNYKYYNDIRTSYIIENISKKVIELKKSDIKIEEKIILIEQIIRDIAGNSLNEDDGVEIINNHYTIAFIFKLNTQDSFWYNKLLINTDL